MDTEWLGKLSKGETSGDQAALVSSFRKSPPLNLGRRMWTKRFLIHVCWHLGVILFDACSDLLRTPNFVAKCYLIRTLSW